ncbi:hypothetical protein MJO28_010606 [Puccinia striiformis f. sp. tritici]|uniref:Uncharacterized protein n=2 Tax=Puccinia striiformis TaxID=27350 RepID=A0A2S4UWX5_9BASI|nr:hypothetical protein Pst134EA_019423 [Puccinia striiformis f. sp. tritici]KAH9449484.1 hypothetical protein Pst134EB_020312 [Puccinia striiformis f. sp. tritici]KAH9459268.1 hypothetical protein Pst134EA_019423 [Puccinia striiformis f. sp. tritici]KAI7944911.1 hypothetical protein MJO28_010606 [Puccinia striiformis f. sp. tritici]POW01772.1 hypothetical protein PSTT_12237 [Puccinia striiformis]
MLKAVLDEKSDLSPAEVQEINHAGIENGVHPQFMKHSEQLSRPTSLLNRSCQFSRPLEFKGCESTLKAQKH